MKISSSVSAAFLLMCGYFSLKKQKTNLNTRNDEHCFSPWNFSKQLTDVSSESKLQLEEKPQYFMRERAGPCVLHDRVVSDEIKQGR